MMIIFLSLSHCYEMTNDLERMIHCLKTANAIKTKVFKPKNEVVPYMDKVILLTNRKYSKVYKAYRELKVILMMMYKKITGHDYHWDFEIGSDKRQGTHRLTYNDAKIAKKELKTEQDVIDRIKNSIGLRDTEKAERLRQQQLEEGFLRQGSHHLCQTCL